MKPKSKSYNNKELGAILNNASAAAFGTQALKSLGEPRKRQIRHYLAAVLEGVIDHVKEGHLKAEELVAVLQAGALFVHVLLVEKSGESRLPVYQDLASRIAKDQDKLPEVAPKGKNGKA